LYFTPIEVVIAKRKMVTDTGDRELYLGSRSVYITLPDAKGRNYIPALA
jgi:hypothetical protein